jgi:hypothetical protein
MATHIVAPTGAPAFANSVTADDTTRPQQPRNRLIPQYREELDEDEPIGQQALARARELAITWWSLLECIRESDAYGEERKGTLPDWARELVGTYAQQHAAHDEYRQWHEAANRALMLAEGEQVAVFEVWGKSGQRLDGQHEFWMQAEASRVKLADQFPGAYVCRVHPKGPVCYGFAHDPALLDTLIGRTYWCGVSFGMNGEQDLHTVQDSTGRTVTATADVLRAHPASHRMTSEGQSRIQAEKAGAA